MEKERVFKLRERRLSVLSACIASILVLVILLFIPSQSSAQTKTLKIGYLLCLSGWYSVYDEAEGTYLKAAAQMINDQGGVTVQGQKYKIELVGEDGKSTLDGATTAATKLVYDHKVKFVIGPSGFFSPASGPIFEQNKVLHISGYVVCQPGELDATTPYGFLSYNAAIGLTIAALEEFRKEYPNVKRLVIPSPDDGAIPYLMPKVKKLLESHGFTRAGEPIPFPNTMQDFSPIVTRINAIKDSDGVLVVNGAPAHFGQIAKGMRALGNKKPMVCVSACDVRDILAVSGTEGGHDVIAQAPIPYGKGNPALLNKIYETANKKVPMEILSANGLWVLTKVIEAANSLDPTVVKAKWETMDGVDSLFGPSTFGGDETYGLKHHAVGHPQSYQKLVNGKFAEGGWVNPGRIP